jgi:hypothetical protein
LGVVVSSVTGVATSPPVASTLDSAAAGTSATFSSGALASTSAIAPRNKEKASNPATNKKSGEDSKPCWKGLAPHNNNNNNNNNNSTNEFLSPGRRREEEEEQGEMGKKEIATTKKKGKRKSIKNLSVNK